MINTMRVAYKIGFSCSLSMQAYSAYADAAKWVFDDANSAHLIDSFCRGWADGYKLSASIKNEIKCKK